MLTDGFISLHRSLLNWEWYDNINTKTLFIHLLLTVNWYDEKWRGIEIKRGQRLTSVAKLSSETSLSIQNIRTALTNLVSTNEITIKTTTKNSIITVLQYDFYQTVTNKTTSEVTSEVTSELTDNQQRTNKELTKSQQLINNTNKANKTNKTNKANIVSGDEISEPPVITIILNDKTEFPIFESQITEWKELYPSVDVMQALRNMKAWCIANPRNRKTKGGVMRFVNGWLSREQDKGKQVQSRPQKSNIGNFTQRQYTEEQLEALIN